jgi:hypothetical protein
MSYQEAGGQEAFVVTIILSIHTAAIFGGCITTIDDNVFFFRGNWNDVGVRACMVQEQLLVS